MVSPNGSTSGASLIMKTCCRSSVSGRLISEFTPSDIVASSTISSTIIAGAVVSITLTNCVVDAEFPLSSVAVHVTMV